MHRLAAARRRRRLEGLEATSHWASLDQLAARIAGDDVAHAIQLGIEYDPQPPFKAGSPETAPPHIVARLRERLRERLVAGR